MKHFICLLIFLILCPALFAQNNPDAPNYSEILPNQIFIMPSTGNTSLYSLDQWSYAIRDVRPAFQIQSSALQSQTGSQLASLLVGYLHDGQDPERLARQLSLFPEIAWAEPIPVPHTLHVPNDPDYAQQAYLPFIKAPEAWEITRGDTNVVVAIIDTGVNYLHNDLFANVWVNPNETLNGQDDSGNGYIDDIHGWDFFSNDNNPRPSTNAHGTHVAGIAAAVTNNNLGIASLGYHTRFMALKAGDGASSAIPFAYQAMIYAADEGADIINCSWGSTRFSRAAELVVDYATERGSLVIAAAGNANSPDIYYPAGYNNAIAVGSVDLNGSKSGFSSYGPFVSVSAPGNGIRSTLLQNQFGASSGTSMAAPVVSALAALLRAAHPDMSNDQIRAQIQGTSREMQTQGTHQRQTGTGYIDAARALGAPVPFVEIFGYSITDVRGNNDGQLEPNESAELHVMLRGMGIPANFRIRITSLDNFIIPEQTDVLVDAITAGDTLIISDIPIRISGQTLDRFDLRAILNLEFIFDGNFSYHRTIQQFLNPSFYTLSANRIAVTLGSEAQIGYLDGPGGSKGIPFILPGESSNTTLQRQDIENRPLLFEGGLMFGNNLGGSSPFVSNAVRSGSVGMVDRDFLSRQAFRIQELENPNGVRAQVTFTDGNAGQNQYGITVTKTAYAFSDPGHDQYVIIRYNFLNTSSQNYGSFISGLFLDFDALPARKNNNVGKYFEEDDILIVAENRNFEQDENALLLAVTVASGMHTPFVIDNTGQEGFFGITNGFIMRDKAVSLRAGKVSTQRGFNQQIHANGTDISVTAAHAPVQLRAQEHYEESFILAWGLGYNDVKNQIENARQRHQNIVSVNPERHTELPTQSSISSIFPNPFNPTTQVSVEIHRTAYYNIAIFDLLGRKISTLHDGTLNAGTHTFAWHAHTAASGIYLVVLQDAHLHRQSRMMSLIR